jgi:charged multivesicular body protein 2A
MAAEGQTKAVHIQAKELVRTRNFITKFLQMRAHLNAVLLKIQTVKSHEAVRELSCFLYCLHSFLYFLVFF